ncbi:epiphycan isoform X1 [Syngnathus acus]|uniref:epiphycan isoform X1 n=1 Tax=Syngnathus acus TaxID=161584 RepID=UPI0018862278|nr:epiphycan isoform X1 [Syngnathus acus]XP_037099670.1 epiphycan isoform X1 [Syngnathus acus]
MMKTLVRLVVGLLVLEAVAANPRFSRQADLDSYDDGNYDVDDVNSENQEYDYEDGPTIEDPEIEIGTLAPPDYNYPMPEASLEEQEEEEEELPIKPQLIPQGSGGSGVLMGPDTQKEVELRLTANDILHVSGDFGGSVGSGALGASGVSGSGGSGDPLVSGASGGSGDIIFISGASEEILSSSGGSGEFLVSGDVDFLISGDLYGSGEVSGSGDLLMSGEILGSGDFLISSHLSGSGDLLISGDLSGSGDLLISGDTMGSTASGASGDFVSGDSGILIELGSSGSGLELPLGSGGSGDQIGSGFSGDLLTSGASGGSGVSGDTDESGESGITLLPGEVELPLIPTTIPQEASGTSGDFSGVSGTSGDLGVSGDIDVSGTSGVSASGEPKEPDIILIPDIDKEEGLLPTQETPQEGTGGVETTLGSGLPEPKEPEEPEVDTKGMPTCLLCTCLGGSVYCDDLKLDSVPPLPKDTTHFYARYNRITKINKSDFASMNKLKRIDLTANAISSIESRAFMGLPELEELVIRENHISQMPVLPETMTLIDASHNNIESKGIPKEAFKDMTGLLYLYLTDNEIDYIPVPLPDSLRSLHLQRNNIQSMHEDTFCNLHDFNYIRNALEDIRLDGNPVNLSRTPQAYVCLPRIPVGDLI